MLGNQKYSKQSFMLTITVYLFVFMSLNIDLKYHVYALIDVVNLESIACGIFLEKLVRRKLSFFMSTSGRKIDGSAHFLPNEQKFHFYSNS